MIFRSAFLGAGPRALNHARAYAFVPSITLEAVADLDAERRNRLAEKFGVKRTFGDFHRMLEAVKPDIVHVITNPDFRAEPVEACARAGVKAVIIEKPMANTLAEGERIERISRETGIKVIVNTQRRYMPTWVALVDFVRARDVGRIQFIRANNLPAIACCGGHMMDMLEHLLGDVDPLSVWATASGAEDFTTGHPGPAHALASIQFPGRIQVLWEASKHGPGIIGGTSFWSAMQFHIVTDKGHLWYTDSDGWGYVLDGEARGFPTNFSEDQHEAQGAFTEAVATWLGDESKPHGNRLETAIRCFRITMAVFQSAVEARRIPYDPAVQRDCAGDLRSALEAREGVHPERVDWSSIPADGS